MKTLFAFGILVAASVLCPPIGAVFILLYYIQEGR